LTAARRLGTIGATADPDTNLMRVPLDLRRSAARALAAALAFAAACAFAQAPAPAPASSSPQPEAAAQPPATASSSSAPASQAPSDAAAPQDAKSESAPVAAPAHAEEAPITVFNRTVVVLRASFLGVPASERAEAATLRVQDLLHRGGRGRIALQEGPQGTAVMIDGQLAFIVAKDDARGVPGASVRSVAEDAKKVLEQIVAETREARDTRFLLRAALHAAVATAVWLALMWLARSVWRWSARRLMGLASDYAPKVRVGGGELVPRERAVSIARNAMALLAVATMLLLTWNWLGYVLGLFPYTRPWSEGLTGFLVGTSLGILEAVARSMPSIFVAIVIFVIAWVADRTQKRFFGRVEAGAIAFGSIDSDTAPATRRLATIAIWLFASAMAYPYIPGSDTDAFKGLSVLLGLMVSVGASGIVGQAVSGLILMYTRTFRTGEYVRIGDREGTLTRLGMFNSTVRTGLGEELTMPNSQVLASVTTNYSRIVEGPGFMLSAKVSIGYDTPWRQVHAMLEEAARRTEGILDSPPPHVFQTSLDDFYVQYRLVCQASPPEPFQRAKIVSALHASIQDVFNEHGVQIMSPHYLGDPASPKIVVPARWYDAPARRDEGKAGG
jgi:small-conductance mechanosensitive channel